MLSAVSSCLIVIYGWSLFSETPFIKDQGDWLGVFAFLVNCLLILIIVEITRRSRRKLVQTATDLQQTNSYLDNLFNYANAPIIVWDANFRITRFNRAFEAYTGRTADEVIGKNLSLLFPADKIDSSMELIRKTLSGERWESVEIPIANVNGTINTVLWNSANIFAEDQTTLVATIAQGHDITNRLNVEKSFRESNAYYRTLFDSTLTGVTVIGSDGILIEANNAFCKMLEYEKEEIIGKLSIAEITYPDDLDSSIEMFKKLTCYEIDCYSFEKRYVSKTGKIIPAVIFVKSISNIDDKYDGCIASIMDISERKRAEEEKLVFEQQLRHSQKLESLGVLSGGIAHDFNNILAIIIGYCAVTRMNYETAEKNIPEIEKAVDRASALCRQMLAYAGKAKLEVTQVNTWLLVDETVKMLKTTLPQNVFIKSDLSKNIPTIIGDDSQLRQIVMNLIINASEAIGKGQGEIQVSLAKTTVTGKEIKDYNGSPIPHGEYIRLEVADNGSGMDYETKLRIFEPFYTTKFTGRGLGMSAVLGIIKSHGGALQLSSQKGQGTTFKVYLPVQNSHSEVNENPVPLASITKWKGHGTILLVEDEDAIRDIAKTLLTIYGFSVLEAVNGKEALELFRKNSTEVTLVITDIGMPVMDGYALYHELKMLNPKLPIIISSGFGDFDIRTQINIGKIDGIINKPYNPDKLRELLESIVGDTQVKI